MSKKFLITGCNGFIGSHIVEYLNKEIENGKDYELVGLDNQDEVFPYNKGVLKDIRGDVRDAELVEKLVQEADYIIHMAGLLGTAETIDYIPEVASVNIVGTLTVLSNAVKYKKRATYITIGNDWLNPYTVTKTCSKDLALILNQYRAGNIVIVRGLNAYGDRQHAYPVRKIFPTFCLEAVKGDKIEIWGDGEQVIDLVHVDDLARGLVLAALAPESPELHKTVIDLGTSIKTTVNKTAELVLKQQYGDNVDWKSFVTYLPLRDGEPKDSITLGKIEKSADLIDYRPEVDLDYGMKQSFDWYKENIGLFDDAEYEKYLHSSK
jgi:UDP-glucose 4-epimerase